ncbi:MAG: hypothetical protein N3B16_05380 [Candidatus Aminicenantes bacterium]|nr:hypothetical protein [Candidatus Aminicenantes bacterium]
MKIYLNLASQPSRNRRFFFLIGGTLFILNLASLFISLWLFIDYQKTFRQKRDEIIRISMEEDALRREERQFTARASALSKSLETEVELVNSIIIEKSFSWSDFFSRLEKALPPTCYLNSLNFNRRPDMKLEVKFRLVAPNLNSYLATIDKLREVGFSGLQVQSEDLSGPSIISEMVMIYEGNN